MNPTTAKLADVISLAAEIREESWNGKTYDVSLKQACITAAEQGELQEISLLVYLLLQYTWNDALAWAQEPRSLVPTIPKNREIPN